VEEGLVWQAELQQAVVLILAVVVAVLGILALMELQPQVVQAS